jgi:TetR/AcrR family transcriptional regulator, transcriptional repressor for nem operon
MAATRPRRQANTAQRILDVAERLVQSRGFNGFSYANVAAELGITTASLHYHYPGKAELGEALIARYAARFADALEAIDGSVADARRKLDAYAGLYADVLRGKRMCLCGILAAEYETLPTPMREAVLRYFDDNETWLTGVLAQGDSDDTLSFAGPPRVAAQTILSGLEGAMLIARPYGDLGRFHSSAGRLLDSLTD